MANCAAVRADTSSAAAGTTPVVGAAAAASCAVIADPMLCKFPAAAVRSSGCAFTNDIRHSLHTAHTCHWLGTLNRQDGLPTCLSCASAVKRLTQRDTPNANGAVLPQGGEPRRQAGYRAGYRRSS